MKQLTSEQASKVAQILKKYKVDLTTVGSHNPWDSNSERSEAFRQFISKEDPTLAAELSAHKAPTLAYLALEEDLAGGADIDLNSLPTELRREYEQRNPEVCANANAALEQRLLQSLEKEHETASQQWAAQRKFQDMRQIGEKAEGQQFVSRWNNAMKNQMHRPARNLTR